MTTKKYKPPHVDLPPLMRLLLWVGKPLGVAFAPQYHVQVIYRMGNYAGCKGPGLFTYNRLTETLGPLVSIAPQVKDYLLDNVISRDVIPVTMEVQANIAYDPQEGHELAPILTRIPREAYTSIAGTYIRWALLAIANQYTATELTQYAVRSKIEEEVRDRCNEEQRFLGLVIKGKIRITRVELPARLTDRHEVIAQRRANILAGAEFHPAEYRRALVSEVIERLARTGETDSFVNFNDMLEAYTPEEGQLPPPPNIVVEPPPPRALEDRGRPAPPAAPPNEETQKKPPRRRPRSRL